MRNCLTWVVLLAVSLSAAGIKERSDQFTPLVAAPLTAKAWPFTGTDGRLHIVYELVLTNTNPTPATLKQGTGVRCVHKPCDGTGLRGIF